jgi:hypothetical protein
MPEHNGNIVVLNPSSTFGPGPTLIWDTTTAEFISIEEAAQLLS